MSDVAAALTHWLERLALRSHLGSNERAAILALPGDTEEIRPNRDFVRLGEHVDRACLIVAGMAGRFGQTRSGERQITAFHIPGDMADLHSVVLPDAASALQSLSDTTIFRVPHNTLKHLAREFPALAEAFWRDCTIDAAVLSQWSLVNGRLAARARIAHLLCELSCRFAVRDRHDGLTFGWPVTQAQLGDATGLTAIHVNRMLRELREAGAADVKDRTVRILDWKTLSTIGEFDPRYLDLHKQG